MLSNFQAFKSSVKQIPKGNDIKVRDTNKLDKFLQVQAAQQVNKLVQPHDPFILLKFNEFQSRQPRLNFLDNKLETNSRNRNELVNNFLKQRGLSFDALPTKSCASSPFKTTYDCNASYDVKVNAISTSHVQKGSTKFSFRTQRNTKLPHSKS